MDWQIHKLARSSDVVLPFEPIRVQPASLDVILDNRFLTYDYADGPIDPKHEVGKLIRTEVENGNCYELGPQKMVLASTYEWFHIPNNIVAKLEGKSSIGRLGVTVHITAGFVDPGFEGQLTLEVLNANKNKAVRLWPGMAIAQLCFYESATFADNPYSPTIGSSYHKQAGPTEYRGYKSFKIWDVYGGNEPT